MTPKGLFLGPLSTFDPGPDLETPVTLPIRPTWRQHLRAVVLPRYAGGVSPLNSRQAARWIMRQIAKGEVSDMKRKARKHRHARVA